jgi:hypothetical protein
MYKLTINGYTIEIQTQAYYLTKYGVQGMQKLELMGYRFIALEM